MVNWAAGTLYAHDPLRQWMRHHPLRLVHSAAAAAGLAVLVVGLLLYSVVPPRDAGDAPSALPETDEPAQTAVVNRSDWAKTPAPKTKLKTSVIRPPSVTVTYSDLAAEVSEAAEQIVLTSKEVARQIARALNPAPIAPFAMTPSVLPPQTADGSHAVDPATAFGAAAFLRQVTLSPAFYRAALARCLSEDVKAKLRHAHSGAARRKGAGRQTEFFEVFFEPGSGDDMDAGTPGPLLYTALTVDGETRRLYRFRTMDGKTDFFDEASRAAKHLLLRKPVARGHFTSPYGMRRHPLLRRMKMHTGVDWAAPRGTPILAAGDGTVDIAGWWGGYGKYVRLSHANGYKTAYAHMTRFAEGMKPGAKVTQGQVIGYVGSTGRSTGPHLHFEVMLNERRVNPMHRHVLQHATLTGPQLVAFHAERRRIDALMHRRPVTEPAAVRVAALTP